MPAARYTALPTRQYPSGKNDNSTVNEQWFHVCGMRMYGNKHGAGHNGAQRRSIIRVVHAGTCVTA